MGRQAKKEVTVDLLPPEYSASTVQILFWSDCRGEDHTLRCEFGNETLMLDNIPITKDEAKWLSEVLDRWAFGDSLSEQPKGR